MPNICFGQHGGMKTQTSSLNQDEMQSKEKAMSHWRLVPDWEEKFPDVRFTDKIAVHFEDGSVVDIKWLYNDTSRLREIDWDTVIYCHEI